MTKGRAAGREDYRYFASLLLAQLFLTMFDNSKLLFVLKVLNSQASQINIFVLFFQEQMMSF